MLKLLNKLYFMFVGDLEVEIQIVFKVVEKSLCPVFPLVCTKGCHDECTMGDNTRLDQLNSQLLQTMTCISASRPPMNIK